MRQQLPTLAKLAGRQHGVVAYWQLIELGFTGSGIHRQVIAGVLHRAYRGVYAVGHPGLSVEGREMAAALACGRGAVVSHWTAAARWELLRPVRVLHVSVTSDRRVPGIRTHFVKRVHPNDRTKRDGIPITSVPRTLLDIAGVANERTLRRAVNEAERSGWLNRTGIQEVLQRNPRRKGARQLRTLIAAVNPGTRKTRSDLEVAFLKACADYGVPTPVTNEKVHGFEVDFHWPGTNLIVELDSYEYHRTPQEFENDRRRDAALKRAGYEVLRIPDTWLDADPAGVAATVKELLGCPD
jgi:uncharacterized protein DUF559